MRLFNSDSILPHQCPIHRSLRLSSLKSKNYEAAAFAILFHGKEAKEKKILIRATKQNSMSKEINFQHFYTAFLCLCSHGQ